MSHLPILRRTLAAAALGLALPVAAAPPPDPAALEVSITGIKSAKGVIRLALCPPQAGFPDCQDRAVRTASLPIENGKAQVVLTGLSAGTYAIAVFHDANANSKLDTFVGIPKEGYGFSRNPPFRPRAPRWEEAVITVAGEARAEIKLRYVL